MTTSSFLSNDGMKKRGHSNDTARMRLIKRRVRICVYTYVLLCGKRGGGRLVKGFRAG